MPYIGRGSDFGVRSRFIYTATAGQTTFSGNDDAGITLAYTDTLYMDVYQNGVLLVPATDYAASTGTSVVLVQGASVGDTVELLVHDIFSVADAVSAKDGGTFSGTIAAAGLSTSSLGTSNFRAGVNAGDSITAGGNYNVVIGDEAGTALTTGDDNVAIGFEALSTEDTGTRAVAVGYRALKTQNNDSTNYNIAIGYDAGLSISTGVQNVIIGGKAGDALTVGDDNVAIGRAALTTDTQGSNSTAVGMNALATQNFTSATDSNNVAVGYNAGTAVTTGTENTLIGALAGDAITTGVSNVAVGYKALTTNVDGDGLTAIGFEALENFEPSDGLRYTVAVGYQAGKACTAGGDNVFVGGQAGLAVTDGNNNIAIGKLALSTNVQGDRNVAVGYTALKAANPSGDSDTNNTAIGYEAGLHVSTGLKNVLIGSEAGNRVDAKKLTTGTQNIVIGHNTGVSASDAANQIVIGSGFNGGADNAVSFGYGSVLLTIGLDGSDTSWAASSDERLKTNVATSTAGLSFINDLRPVTYEWKQRKDVPSNMTRFYEEGSTEECLGSGETYHGFLAQEVKTVIDNHSEVKQGSNIWSQHSDGTQQLAEGHLVPMLTKAVQELSAKNDALEARLAALEAK